MPLPPESDHTAEVAESEPRPLSFAPGVRLTLVLDPAGRVVAVPEVKGLGSPPAEVFLGSTPMDLSAQRVGGAERAVEWERRLAIARESTESAHYTDPPPGQGLDVPPTVDCTVTPIRDAAGVLTAILVDVDDRTDVVETQRRLSASEERFRLLAESLPQMVWTGTSGEEAGYFSARWEAFTGRTAAELVGRGYLDLVHPDDLGRLADWRRPIDEGDPLIFRMRRHDGEYRWLESHIAVLTDDGGADRMTVGGTTDITDRLAQEEHRLRSQKREAIGTLAAGIAHDFNNAIGAILSNATLAQQEIDAGRSPSTSVSEIAQGAVRASALVRRMLDYSREDEPASEPVSIAEVVRDACGLLQPTLGPGLSLNRAAEPGLLPVLGDASQLHQIVMNLVTNARQAIGAATGAIDVLVDELAVDATTDGAAPTGTPPGHYVRLRVRDDGPGMPEAVRRRALDPFFTTKPASEGIGLGLAAAQTIARRHDGTIDVESADGRGTTVTVLLPAHRADGSEAAPGGSMRIAPASAASAASTEAAAGTSTDGSTDLTAPTGATGAPRLTPRVVFVDDEPSLTMLADRALPIYGCEPVAFTDPRAALEAIAATPHAFDALITDHSMPGLTGLELAVEVRAVRPDLPVILTSGFLSPAHRDEAHRAGVDAIVPKPCSIEDLANAALALVVRPSADGTASA